MNPRESRTDWSAAQCAEVTAWLEEHEASECKPVREFAKLQLTFLRSRSSTGCSMPSVFRQLLRALRITPSSEKRPSGRPLSGVPKAKRSRVEEYTRLERNEQRSQGLGDWHRQLAEGHDEKAEKAAEKRERISEDMTPEERKRLAEEILELERTPVDPLKVNLEPEPSEDSYGRQFAARVALDAKNPDEALQSVQEALMPASVVAYTEEEQDVECELGGELADAEVKRTLWDKRERFDISMQVRKLTLNVEKKVVVTSDGERKVVGASTREFGPRGFALTWNALATLAVLVCQFALPLNRIATLFSTPAKRFTAGGLGRVVHHIAMQLVPIYLALLDQIADAEILAGDDTSSRVIEVTKHFKTAEHGEPGQWRDYRNAEVAAQSYREHGQRYTAQLKQKESEGRNFKVTLEPEPSLGVQTSRELGFQFPRRNADGPKQSLNTTVVTGRSVSKDPRSLIVLYRSHLGSFGNLLEVLLEKRRRSLRKVIVQSDLSTTNLVASDVLQRRFKIRHTGCGAHARRPFAIYEDEDPIFCQYMLHLFTGLAIHEKCLDDMGRNKKNVKAVRTTDSAKLWKDILKLAKTMTRFWAKSTKLGAAANYIIKNYDKLTAYLKDPRLEPSNNMRERMLRTEKLIQRNALFRKTLEGRFAFDILRTILQTAAAADAPAHAYLVDVLKADPETVRTNPEDFTPYAWANRHHKSAAANED